MCTCITFLSVSFSHLKRTKEKEMYSIQLTADFEASDFFLILVWHQKH